MAELTTSCCAPAAHETCCEPAGKASCCRTSAAGGSCGCSAGQAIAPAADIRETVREKYAAAALLAGEASGWCCDAGFDAAASGVQTFGPTLYGEEATGAPEAAVNASLGC